MVHRKLSFHSQEADNGMVSEYIFRLLGRIISSVKRRK